MTHSDPVARAEAHVHVEAIRLRAIQLIEAMHPAGPIMTRLDSDPEAWMGWAAACIDLLREVARG